MLEDSGAPVFLNRRYVLALSLLLLLSDMLYCVMGLYLEWGGPEPLELSLSAMFGYHSFEWLFKGSQTTSC